MKKLFLLTVLIAYCFQLNAEDGLSKKKDEFKIGYGIKFEKAGSMWGEVLNVIYQYKITPYLGIEPQLELSRFMKYSSFREGSFDLSHIRCIDLSACYSPFAEKRNNLLFDFGLSLRTGVRINGTSYWSGNNEFGTTYDKPYSPGIWDENLFGLAASISYNIYQNETYNCGIKATFRSYYRKDNNYLATDAYRSFGISVYLGINP